jgi:dCMP deaminase
MAETKHHFVKYPNGEKANACVQCGFPPTHVVHHFIEKDELKDKDHSLLKPPPTKAERQIEQLKRFDYPKASSRLARAELFMQAAELFAKRSSCERGHVGAVLVKEGRIISTGYNGAPPGMKHCLEVGCEEVEGTEGCQRTIHAEANAIVWAARMGVPTLDSIMYSTHSPCASCARLIIAAGVCKVVFRNDYRLARLDLLDQACVLTEKL